MKLAYLQQKLSSKLVRTLKEPSLCRNAGCRAGTTFLGFYVQVLSPCSLILSSPLLSMLLKLFNVINSRHYVLLFCCPKIHYFIDSKVLQKSLIFHSFPHFPLIFNILITVILQSFSSTSFLQLSLGLSLLTILHLEYIRWLSSSSQFFVLIRHSSGSFQHLYSPPAIFCQTSQCFLLYMQS